MFPPQPSAPVPFDSLQDAPELMPVANPLMLTGSPQATCVTCVPLEGLVAVRVTLGGGVPPPPEQKPLGSESETATELAGSDSLPSDDVVAHTVTLSELPTSLQATV